MIPASVPAFTVFTGIVWAVSGVIVLLAFGAAWQGKLVMSLVLSAAAAAGFNFPVIAMFTGLVKLQFARPDQLLETSIGTAISAIGLVFAMTGAGVFGVAFAICFTGCLILYGIGSLVS